MFLLITYVIIGMSFLQIRGDAPWYTYLLLIILLPVSVFLTIKVFINYKRIEIGNNQIAMFYPVRRFKRKYDVKNIQSWIELSVKTGKKSTFRELQIQFEDNFKLNLGEKEYTHYKEILQYLSKKAGNKKREPVDR